MTSSDDFDAENSAVTLASIGPDMPASKNVKGGSDKGLLPAGLSDLLAPQAQQDADAVAAVLSCFSQFGYQRIKPPLLEFETSLLGDGPGAALAEQTFRLLDPISRRMMALRSDMTAQIARISGTRLASRPRPLRLAYGGDVMRVVPDVLNPERQLVQAGAEIIGRDDEGAVAEIILAGVLGLQKAGIKDVTLDLGLPHLAEVLLGKELAVMDAAIKQQLFEAIGNRDISALAGLPIAAAQKLADVMTASGASTDALRARKRIDVAFIGSCTNGRLSDLQEVANHIKGHKVAEGVQGIVVPGSQVVAQIAEQLGLDKIFKEAGFEWRGAGCSMCLAMNPDKLVGNQLCASSSNRNFKGRQGSPTGRTMLMSPLMVAAAAVRGEVADAREVFEVKVA